ncbi:MAG: hypothetical protein AB1813_13610 [Verrucomicrobiota bacterium]
MPADDNGTQTAPPVEIILDGRRVELSDVRTLKSLRTKLELLAMQQDRILSVVLVDGVPVTANEHETTLDHFHQVSAETISLQEFSRRMVNQALDQVEALSTRVEAGVFLVLINESKCRQRWWREWQADFREPILTLGFLQDLYGAKLRELQVNDRPLAMHMEDFGLIACLIELLLLHPGPVGTTTPDLALSDVLEARLIPWLRELNAYLKRFHEQT